MIVSERIGEKALRLVDDHRVGAYELERQTPFGAVDVAVVSSDSGFHTVTAGPIGVFCDCPAWKPDRYCSHAVAAMIAWSDRA